MSISEVLPFFESLYVALFMLAIVFVALFGLYLCVRLFSLLVMKLESTKKKQAASPGVITKP